MKILGLIPARGGSKGVPKKNIKLLGGKPLIEYSIKTALGIPLIDTLVVSTDDKEIADISEELGAFVPGLRPKSLATDESPTIDTVIYVLNQLKSRGLSFDAIILLQPTSPFRTSVSIQYSIEKFIKNKYDSLFSVLKVPSHFNPYWVYASSADETLSLAVEQESIISRRQDLPNCYIRSGDIYIVKSEIVLSEKSLYGKSIGYYLMDKDLHVNIDTNEDWLRAEAILNERINGKGRNI